jgi:hypothetical protein
MFTTNASSRLSPLTFLPRRIETEELVEISRQIEQAAMSKPGFEDDPEFQALNRRFEDQLLRVLSLKV